MRIPFSRIIVDAVAVERVDAHLPVRVNDLLVIEHNSNVNNPAFVVIKKSQIAGLGLVRKIYFFALRNLLPGIAGQLVPANAKTCCT